MTSKQMTGMFLKLGWRKKKPQPNGCGSER